MKKIIVDIKLLPATLDDNNCIYLRDGNVVNTLTKIMGWVPYQITFSYNNKVFASSNGLINGNNVPLIPQTFISKFCKMNASIKQVLIAWDEEAHKPIVRKHDNSVIVSKMKETFTTEDVHKMLQYFVEDYDNSLLTEYLIYNEQIITP